MINYGCKTKMKITYLSCKSVKVSVQFCSLPAESRTIVETSCRFMALYLCLCMSINYQSTIKLVTVDNIVWIYIHTYNRANRLCHCFNAWLVTFFLKLILSYLCYCGRFCVSLGLRLILVVLSNIRRWTLW